MRNLAIGVSFLLETALAGLEGPKGSDKFSVCCDSVAFFVHAWRMRELNSPRGPPLTQDVTTVQSCMSVTRVITEYSDVTASQSSGIGGTQPRVQQACAASGAACRD